MSRIALKSAREALRGLLDEYIPRGSVERRQIERIIDDISGPAPTPAVRRDAFAAAALQGLLASSDDGPGVAGRARDYADALIAALDKTAQPEQPPASEVLKVLTAVVVEVGHAIDEIDMEHLYPKLGVVLMRSRAFLGMEPKS